MKNTDDETKVILALILLMAVVAGVSVFEPKPQCTHPSHDVEETK